MNSSILAVADTVIVAISVIALVGGIVITSIVRYKADDFVKFWAAAGTVIGLALGGVGTFFFTKGKVEQTQVQLEHKQDEVDRVTKAWKTSESEKADIANKINALSQYVTWNPVASSKLKDLVAALKTEKPEIYYPEKSPQLAVSPAPKGPP